MISREVGGTEHVRTLSTKKNDKKKLISEQRQVSLCPSRTLKNCQIQCSVYAKIRQDWCSPRCFDFWVSTSVPWSRRPGRPSVNESERQLPGWHSTGRAWRGAGAATGLAGGLGPRRRGRGGEMRDIDIEGQLRSTGGPPFSAVCGICGTNLKWQPPAGGQRLFEEQPTKNWNQMFLLLLANIFGPGKTSRFSQPEHRLTNPLGELSLQLSIKNQWVIFH